jgi:hypothetical protein
MDKNTILLYTFLTFGIGIVLFTFGDIMYSNYDNKNKKSKNTNTLDYLSKDEDELKKLIDITNNPNLSNSYSVENDEVYTDITEPENDQYIDTKDSIPIQLPNMTSDNKRIPRRNTILDQSLSELISMSNSMIDFHKPKKLRVRYDDIDTINPRFEDYSPVDTTFISSNYESNYVNQPDFPENTSTVLPNFNGDNVAQLYPTTTITNLYDTLNSDIYKGYKTWDFI